MPNVHLPGSALPDLRATVHGGIAVALHSPADVDGLLAVCRWAPRPPEAPMVSVYRALVDASLDLEAWARHWRDEQHPPSRAPESARPASDVESQWASDWPLRSPFPSGDLSRLMLGLQLARAIWLDQQEDAQHLVLVVLLAEPGVQGAGQVRLEGDGAALTFQPGSLLAEAMRLPLSATSFAVCLLVGGGTTTGARSAEMVSRTRTQALSNGARQLRTLEDLVRGKAEPGGRPGPKVVLVHGLFGTDVGTFGALQTRLEEHFDVFGFPHDSVNQSIEANGRELAVLLAHLSDHVMCVAHSRGGLVVRSAAVELVDLSGDNFGISHCATFGTPHMGAAMAENPGTLIAVAALLRTFVGDRSLAGVVEMLCGLAEARPLPGISDLRPASSQDRWLAQFQREEGLFPGGRMQLLTVDGVAQPKGLGQQVAHFAAQRILGHQPSDLIVTQASSRPLLLTSQMPQITTNCHHFGYFREDQASVLDQVVSFLSKAAGVPSGGAGNWPAPAPVPYTPAPPPV